jgi:protein-disulfide isomerase
MLSTIRTAVALGALGIAAAAPAALAQDPAPLSQAERSAVEQVVRDYLLAHPEVIMEALTVLQTRQEQSERQRQAEQLSSLDEEIFRSPGSPVMGNPEGNVTLVEFFDYQCGYCKSMLEPLNALRERDPDLRMVMKELPILSPASTTAAKAALAAELQGKYTEFHLAMMGYRGRLDDDVVFATAEQVGLDVERLKADMESEAVAAEIAANMRLAQQLGIRGTPAFIVGDDIVPGAVDVRALEALIAEQRGEG